MEEPADPSSFQGQMAARYKERLSMSFAFNKSQSDRDGSQDVTHDGESLQRSMAGPRDAKRMPEANLESTQHQSPSRLSPSKHEMDIAPSKDNPDVMSANRNEVSDTGSSFNELCEFFNKLDKRSGTSSSLSNKRGHYRRSVRQRMLADKDDDSKFPTSSSSCVEAQYDRPRTSQIKRQNRTFSPEKESENHKEEKRLNPTDLAFKQVEELFRPVPSAKKQKESPHSEVFDRNKDNVSRNSTDAELKHLNQDAPSKSPSQSPKSSLPKEPLRVNLKDFVRRRKEKKEEAKYLVHKKEWGKRSQPQQPNLLGRASRPSSRQAVERGDVQASRILSSPMQEKRKQGVNDKSLQEKIKLDEKRGTAMERYLLFLNRSTPPVQDASIEAIRRIEELESQRSAALQRQGNQKHSNERQRELSSHHHSPTKEYNHETLNYELSQQKRLTPEAKERAPSKDPFLESQNYELSQLKRFTPQTRERASSRAHNLEALNHELSQPKRLTPQARERAPSKEHNLENPKLSQSKRFTPQARERTNSIPPRPPSGAGHSRQQEPSRNLFKTASEEVSYFMEPKTDKVKRLRNHESEGKTPSHLIEKVLQIFEASHSNTNKYGIKKQAGLEQNSQGAFKTDRGSDASMKSSRNQMEKRHRDYLLDATNETGNVTSKQFAEKERLFTTRSRSSSAERQNLISGIGDLEVPLVDSAAIADLIVKGSSSPTCSAKLQQTGVELAATNWQPRKSKDNSKDANKKRSRLSSHSSEESDGQSDISPNRRRRQRELLDMLQKQELGAHLHDAKDEGRSFLRAIKRNDDASVRESGAAEGGLFDFECTFLAKELESLKKYQDGTTDRKRPEREKAQQDIEEAKTFHFRHRDPRSGRDQYPREKSSERMETKMSKESRHLSTPFSLEAGDRRSKRSTKTEEPRRSPGAQSSATNASSHYAVPRGKHLGLKQTTNKAKEQRWDRGEKMTITKEGEMTMIPCHFGSMGDKAESDGANMSTGRASGHSPQKKRRKLEKGKLLKKKKRKQRELSPEESPVKSEKAAREKKMVKPRERQRRGETLPTMKVQGREKDNATRQSTMPFQTSPEKVFEKPMYSPKISEDLSNLSQRSPLRGRSRRSRHSTPEGSAAQGHVLSSIKLSPPSFRKHAAKKIKLPKIRPIRRLTGEPTIDYPIKSNIPLFIESFAPPLRKCDMLVKYRRMREGLMDPKHPSRLPLTRDFKDALDCAVVEEWALHCWQPESDIFMDETGTWWSCAKEETSAGLAGACSLLEPSTIMSKEGLLDLGSRVQYMKLGPLRVAHATWLAFAGVCALIGQIGARLYKCNGEEFDYFCAEGDVACLIPHSNYPTPMF